MSARSFVLNKRRQNNITVENESGIRRLLLHGNCIVTHNLVNDVIEISDCGWKTATTKIALNRYFSLIDLNAGIHQAKGVWFLNYGQQLINLDDHNGTYTIYAGSKEVKDTKIARLVYKDRIIAEKGSSIVVKY